MIYTSDNVFKTLSAIWQPFFSGINMLTCFHFHSADWSPRDSDSLILLLETWQPVLPPWILNNILEQIVLPRLQAEVENWNPLTDTMPIHAWLHPWLPLMEKRLEPLWAPIRNKLANALRNWHPSDPSAKLILQPWLQVWTGGQVDSFLVKNIVPKLGLCLQEFIINPHQQHLGRLTGACGKLGVANLSWLPWVFPEAPLKVSGAPGNIQGNLTALGLV